MLAVVAMEAKADARDLKGQNEWTTLVPGDLFFVQESLDEGKEFAAEAQRKKGVNLGSAHVRIALKGILGMAKTEELQDQAELQDGIKAFWKEVVTAHPKEDLPFFISVFRVTKPRKASAEVMGGTYAKVTFRFTNVNPLFPASQTAFNFQAAVLKAFRNKGWQVKAGAAPRSTNERLLKEIANRL